MSPNTTNPSPTVIFLPSGRRGTFPKHTTILDAAQQLGEAIENTCGGHLLCGKCKVRIETGSFLKFGIESSPGHVSPLTEDERALLGSDSLRLACNAKILDDIVVFVPEQSRVHQQTIRKDAGDLVVTVEPTIKQFYVKLKLPTPTTVASDWELLRAALETQWRLLDLTIALPALQTLQETLRRGDWQATVVVFNERHVMDVRPGYQEGVWGVAIDIGSTTIAAYLCDLETGELLASYAQMNPQVSYGEDLMSRISYATQNKDGLKKLHRSVIGAVNRVSAEVAQIAGISPQDIQEAVIVGNTTMVSLFLGIHPRFLGEAPFMLANRDPMDWKASMLNLRLHPSANVHILPAIAGHVGADNVAVLLAESPQQREDTTLIIDVGTNAEIDLWDGRQLYCASSPTGPAFEGAQITFGMRAAPGAIERVRIHRETLQVTYKIIGEERWSDEWTPEHPPALTPTGICGSGIIEAIAELYLAGILLPDGRFNPESQSDRIRWEGKRGAFILAPAEETSMNEAILITSEDVRAIQLAKAALYAGCKVLMQEAGVETIERITLAGAFGSYISPFHAMVLGLIPDAPLDNVTAVGNAAGDGARIALLNKKQRVKAEEIARSVHYVETATHPHFQSEFVKAIHFPHQTDAFPHIESQLPKTTPMPRGRSRRRIRHRRK